MDILFFITTLITGAFIGIVGFVGVFAIIIRKDDERRAQMPPLPPPYGYDFPDPTEDIIPLTYHS